MDPLGKELSGLFSELGLKEIYTLSVLQQKRQVIFGEFLAEHLWPARLQEGVLYLNVSSRHILLTLNTMKGELLKKLAPYGIKDLMISVGRVKQVKKKRKPSPSMKKSSIPKDLRIALDEEIKDPALRTTVEQTIRAWLCRK